MTSFQSVFRSVFVFPPALLFARYSPFYLCLFLFSFAFPSLYSTYFSVLSNVLTRFISTRCTPYTSCFIWSLCLFLSSLFSLKTLSTRTCIITIYSAWKVLALPVLLLCELIRNWKILRITIQLQPQQFVFPLKTRIESFLLTRLHIY